MCNTVTETISSKLAIVLDNQLFIYITIHIVEKATNCFVMFYILVPFYVKFTVCSI